MDHTKKQQNQFTRKNDNQSKEVSKTMQQLQTNTNTTYQQSLFMPSCLQSPNTIIANINDLNTQHSTKPSKFTKINKSAKQSSLLSMGLTKTARPPPGLQLQCTTNNRNNNNKNDDDDGNINNTINNSISNHINNNHNDHGNNVIKFNNINENVISENVGNNSNNKSDTCSNNRAIHATQRAHSTHIIQSTEADHKYNDQDSNNNDTDIDDNINDNDNDDDDDNNDGDGATTNQTIYPHSYQ